MEQRRQSGGCIPEGGGAEGTATRMVHQSTCWKQPGRGEPCPWRWALGVIDIWYT